MIRPLSRLCILLIAFSVLFAGISLGHAAGHSDVNGFTTNGETFAHHQAPSSSSAQHQKAECQEEEAGSDPAGTTKHKANDGCCHIACFPSVAPRDILELSEHVFKATGFVPAYDETAVSADPEGRLRPPRFLA
jgi:hypothetical protein